MITLRLSTTLKRRSSDLAETLKMKLNQIDLTDLKFGFQSLLFPKLASSSLALRRLLSSTVVPRSLRAVRPVAASSRLFNTKAVRNYEDGVDRNHHSNRHVSRRGGGFFSDMFDPLIPTRSLSQMLNFMDEFTESPFVSATRGMGASGVRRGLDVKEKDDVLHLRIDMPGLSRKDLKLALEHNILVIKGEGKTEEEGDVSGDGRRFTSRIGLPEKVYKTDEIKPEIDEEWCVESDDF